MARDIVSIRTATNSDHGSSSNHGVTGISGHPSPHSRTSASPSSIGNIHATTNSTISSVQHAIQKTASNLAFMIRLCRPTVPAANEIFAIPEILENILLHLPMQDLLLAQRVDKTFHGVINSSIHIKRALFFQLQPQTDGNDGLTTPPRLNPLLRKMFPARLGRNAVDYTGKLDSNRDQVFHAMAQSGQSRFTLPENSLPMMFPGHYGKETDLHGMHWIDELIDEQFSLHLPVIRRQGCAKPYHSGPSSEAQMYEKASWRRMFPTAIRVGIHRVVFNRSVSLSGILHHADMGAMEWGNMGFIMEKLDLAPTIRGRVRR